MRIPTLKRMSSGFDVFALASRGRVFGSVFQNSVGFVVTPHYFGHRLVKTQTVILAACIPAAKSWVPKFPCKVLIKTRKAANGQICCKNAKTRHIRMPPKVGSLSAKSWVPIRQKLGLYPPNPGSRNSNDLHRAFAHKRGPEYVW